MAYPWLGPKATTFRTNMSRVPRRSSGLASFIVTPRNSTYTLEFAECQHFPASSEWGEANGDHCRDSAALLCNRLISNGVGGHHLIHQGTVGHLLSSPYCTQIVSPSGVHVTGRTDAKGWTHNSFMLNKKEWGPGWESNPSGGLILRNLLILGNAKMERSCKNAEPRYTTGTWNHPARS